MILWMDQGYAVVVTHSAGPNPILRQSFSSRGDVSRSGVSKIEARLCYVDDGALLYLAEVLKLPLQDLFPTRGSGDRIHYFFEWPDANSRRFHAVATEWLSVHLLD